ncbi:MAG: hypothetical protein PF445_10395 [Melioribacteraceae bacterium]|nr:hypothetical protein [Melioribacteraceae bacterium]
MRKNRKIVFVILLFLLVSCSKKEEEKNYVAKVGDSYLTETMIEESLNLKKDVHKFREEFIREWIETELIYLDAINKEVVNSEEYEKVITNAKVEVAKALVIKKQVSDLSISASEKELKIFFSTNIAEFKIATTRLIYNQITFANKESAIKFRRMIISKGWKNSTKYFEDNNIQFSVKENKFEYVYNVLQEDLKNQLLMIDEKKYSGVIEISKNIFSVVQLLKIYKKNDVPEFEEIADEIEQKFFSFKRKELYNNYLKGLYSEYSSEIER